MVYNTFQGFLVLKLGVTSAGSRHERACTDKRCASVSCRQRGEDHESGLSLSPGATMSKVKKLARWWWFESKGQEPILRINSKLRCVSLQNGHSTCVNVIFFSPTTLLRAPSSSS